MLRRRIRHRLCSASRTATAWLLAVVYTGVALGVPVPVPSRAVADSSGTPYPCQGGRCGCCTADQCWKSCCCHTSRERLAWAEAHGVTPPSYLVIAAQLETTLAKPRSCCAHKHVAEQPATVTSETSTAATPAATITWISALDAGRCRGATPVWNNVPISLPPTIASSLPYFEPCIRPLATYCAADPFSPSFAPPDPPPWIS